MHVRAGGCVFDSDVAEPLPPIGAHTCPCFVSTAPLRSRPLTLTFLHFLALSETRLNFPSSLPPFLSISSLLPLFAFLASFFETLCLNGRGQVRASPKFASLKSAFCGSARGEAVISGGRSVAEGEQTAEPLPAPPLQSGEGRGWQVRPQADGKMSSPFL